MWLSVNHTQSFYKTWLEVQCKKETESKQMLVEFSGTVEIVIEGLSHNFSCIHGREKVAHKYVTVMVVLVVQNPWEYKQVLVTGRQKRTDHASSEIRIFPWILSFSGLRFTAESQKWRVPYPARCTNRSTEWAHRTRGALPDASALFKTYTAGYQCEALQQ